VKRVILSITTLSVLALPAQNLPKPLPAPPSQDAKMKWFRDAKFGLFIHWGLYAIPAG
jgi:alpha-L-fucosidase